MTMTMAGKRLLLFVSFGVMVRWCDCANILAFYPFPGVSHHRVYWPVLRQLAEKGHNVTVFTPFTLQQPPAKNYKEISVPDYLQQCMAVKDRLFKWGLPVWLVNYLLLREINLMHTRLILKEPAFQWLVSSDSEFDAIIGEFTFAEETYAVLTHRFRAIYIEMASFGNSHWASWLLANHIDTSYMADISVVSTDRMDFYERLYNAVFSLTHRALWYYYYIPKSQQLADQYIRYEGWEKRGDIMEILSGTSLYLVNSHYSLNYPYPLSPHTKEIGGVNLQQHHQPIPNDLKKFMDEASEGFIYFSMGSYLSAVDLFSAPVLMDVFSRVKQRVIWKWEEVMPDLPANVKMGKWFPQPSVLGHKNCKLFISHGGFLSLSETIAKGVPVLSIPIFADQPRNARLVQAKRIGIKLELSNVTQQSLYWAVNELIHNPRYKENAVRQSEIFRDKPETALETAVYWIEYVIRHKGAPHLRPAIADMPWYRQAMLDVYLTLLLIILVPFYIGYRLLRFLLKLLLSVIKGKSRNKDKRD